MQAIRLIIVLLASFPLSATASAQLFDPGPSVSALFADLAGAYSRNRTGPLQAFTPTAITSMSDGDLATGFEHVSHFGDNHPNQIFGIEKRFEFDVSEFESIEQITFTWTGRHQWNQEVNNSFPTLRFGVPSLPFAMIDFGGTTDDTIRQVSATFERGAGGVSDLSNVLNGDIAHLVVTNSLFTSLNTNWDFISIETLEVTARPTSIPEPTSLAPMLIGVFFSCIYRRKLSR